MDIWNTTQWKVVEILLRWCLLGKTSRGRQSDWEAMCLGGDDKLMMILAALVLNGAADYVSLEAISVSTGITLSEYVCGFCWCNCPGPAVGSCRLHLCLSNGCTGLEFFKEWSEVLYLSARFHFRSIWVHLLVWDFGCWIRVWLLCLKESS